MERAAVKIPGGLNMVQTVQREFRSRGAKTLGGTTESLGQKPGGKAWWRGTM